MNAKEAIKESHINYYNRLMDAINNYINLGRVYIDYENYLDNFPDIIKHLESKGYTLEKRTGCYRIRWEMDLGDPIDYEEIDRFKTLTLNGYLQGGEAAESFIKAFEKLKVYEGVGYKIVRDESIIETKPEKGTS